MERFTIGIGHYTQQDVHDAARAFCGWSLSSAGQFAIADYAVDDGIKTVLGHTGDLDGDDVVTIVTHDPNCAPFVTARLWSWLAYPVTPANPVVAELVKAFAKDLNVGNLVAAILRHPKFLSDQAINGLVKQPTEYLVGTMRRLGMTTATFKDNNGAVMSYLTSLGQTLFDPPNVGGWGLNEYWCSTATSLARLQVAISIAQVADLSEMEAEPAWARLEWVQNRLGVDHFSAATTRTLTESADQPQQLLALAMVTPEYTVN